MDNRGCPFIECKLCVVNTYQYLPIHIPFKVSKVIMSKLKKVLLIISSVSLVLVSNVQAASYIHAGRLLDMTNNKMQQEMTIVVEANKITDVKRGFVEPATSTDSVINLKDHTVMPGLMDMHTHLSMQFGPTVYLDRFRKEQADVAFQSVVYAKRTLDAGFTTVRDLGDSDNITVSLRNAINKGLIEGPRVYTAAKSIATTGGHADGTNGINSALRPQATPEDGVIDGPHEAAKAVRQRYKDGADVIKITATGGVLSVAKNGLNPQFNQEEMNAIMQTAKDYGFRVAAHAHGAEGMKRALRAGVTSIEHGTYMDKEVMDLMKKSDAYYVPTILAGAWVAEKAKIDGFFPAVVRPKAAAIGPLIQATFGRAHKAKVKIAFGTDSGVSEHGRNAEEFALMVDAGMSPVHALRSATVSAAELLEVSDKLGTIERGKLADIIAVEGNPLDDITLMQTVAFVMKDGKVYKQ